MNKWTLGMLAGFVLGITVSAIIISGDSVAAPFDSVVTKRASLGFVTSFCVFRTLLPDGGADSTFEARMLIPETRTLSDGGTRTTSSTIVADQCMLRSGAKAAADNFAEGAAATCVRSNNDLEQ